MDPKDLIADGIDKMEVDGVGPEKKALAKKLVNTIIDCERERCAKIAEDMPNERTSGVAAAMAREIAAAIRRP